MRITRRTSGGRGEYEISETSPEGMTPNELLDRHIFLGLGDIDIDTGLQLTAQGHKRRLRRISGGIQVQRQVAAALMMPDPIRADSALGQGAPVIQSHRFAIEHIQISNARLIGSDDAFLRAASLTLRNAMTEAEELPVAERVVQLRAVWEKKGDFPSAISTLIAQHESMVTSGGPIPVALENVVAQLQAEVSESSGDLGIVYSQQVDVLPALIEALNLEDQVREPTITVDEVDPEEVDVRLRTLKEWKRWANARGPKSALFRQKVREAYRSTCVICGVRFSKTRFNAAGVDAAHILPWSNYDLDEVINGICLCKLHHWAFDEGLLRIVHRSGAYYTEMPLHVEEKLRAEDPRFDISSLQRHLGRIPEARLPNTRALWPRPQFLDMLNASQESAQPASC